MSETTTIFRMRHVSAVLTIAAWLIVMWWVTYAYDGLISVLIGLAAVLVAGVLLFVR